MLSSPRAYSVLGREAPGSRIVFVPTLVAAFVFGLPLVVLAGNDDPASLPQSVWLQVGVLFLWVTRLANSRPGPSVALFRSFAPVSVFLAWSAISLVWVTDAYAATRVLCNWIAAAGLTFLIADVVRGQGEGRRLLGALYASAVVVSSAGLLQHLGGWDAIPQAFPPAGTLGNKNVAAEFVAAALPSGASLFLIASTPFSTIALSGSLGVALAFVFHTGCRAAWLAVLATCLVATVWRLASPKATTPSVGPMRPVLRGMCLGVGALVFAVLVTRPASDPTSRVEGPRELIAEAARPVLRSLEEAAGAPAPDPSEAAVEPRASRSVSLRLRIWRNTLEMIPAAPWLGIGVGNFGAHYPRFARSTGPDGTRIDERVENAHNDFLQGAAEMGLVGTLIFAWAASSLARAASRERHSPALRNLRPTTAFTVLALVVIATLSPVVTQPCLLGAVAVAAGLAISPTGIGRGSPVAAPSAWSQEFRSAALALAASALVVMGSWGRAQIRADQHVLRMAQAESREDWSTVVAEGLLARAWNPGRTDPRFAPASALLRLNQPLAAAELLRELLGKAPYHANALGNLAIAHMRSGETAQAQVCLERLLRLRPDDEIALSLMAQLREDLVLRGNGPRRP
jgi:O-antigen ligase